MFARLATAARFAITGVAPTTWFDPQQPLAPMAPPQVKGRQFDYPFGANIDYTPRSNQAIGFGELRALADALPLLRTIIETRKDQIAASSFAVRLRDAAPQSAESTARIQTIMALLDRPDRRHSFAAWLRMLLEDMLVIDAATIYPRFTRAGALYSLDIIDGSTIKPLIGEDGRAPEAPDPAYQQVLHGIPAADFSGDELLYLPRNVRAHRLYGMSPVEQIALTINIALRRDVATLDYYRTGTAPAARDDRRAAKPRRSARFGRSHRRTDRSARGAIRPGDRDARDLSPCICRHSMTPENCARIFRGNRAGRPLDMAATRTRALAIVSPLRRADCWNSIEAPPTATILVSIVNKSSISAGLR
jgi:hypothetical protein